MQTTYRPGHWYVLVAPGALIALSPDAPETLVANMWERQQSGGDLAAVIDALTEQASGSFAAMLSFAAVVREGADARIAVRGDVTVQITGPEGSESFTGTNVTTWSERFVLNVSWIAVSAGDVDDVAALPITGGVVRAARVSADIEPADVAAPDAASIVESPVVESPVVESSVVESPVAEEPSEPGPETEQLPELPASIDEAAGDVADDAVEGATLVPSDVTDETDGTSETDGTDEDDIDEFEQLFGETIASPDAVVPPALAPAPPAVGVGAVPTVDTDGGDRDGDHDGATISVAEARALRRDVPTAEPEAPTAVLPVVSGGAGRVRVSTGQIVTLDRTVIVGRRPRSTRASGADLPHLVAVESPQQDISRSHLEIRPEGDTVVVIDLRTTNGSTLLRPGADPLRLHPGEQTLVLSGDVVDLGDGVTVTFEDLP